MQINNKNKKLISFIRIILILLIVLIICTVAGSITKRKDSDRKYTDFKENARNIDVLFIGSSHVLNGINPAVIYSETGITSYNMGKPGGMVPESYWTYKLARQYGKPKCVVIDLWSLDRDYKYLDIMTGNNTEDEIQNSVSLLHTNMDTWPLNGTKIDAVKDLISSNTVRAEFLFPFSLYHSRWNAVYKDDFILNNSKSDSNIYVLGSEAREEIYIEHNPNEPDDKSGTLSEETVSTQYLRKLIEECSAEGIEVIMTFLPMTYSHYQDFQAANYGEQLADEYGLEFINLLDHSTLTLVDFTSDMSDESHLNESGMYKVSKYIAERLSERDYLADHRNDEGYDFFESTCHKWHSDLFNQLLAEEHLYRKLNLINMLNANVALLMRADSPAMKDSFICNLIKEIAGSDTVDRASGSGGPYFLLKQTLPDTGETIVFERSGESQDSDIPTCSGTGEYIGLRDFVGFYTNGNYDDNYFDMEDNYYADLQLLILEDDDSVLDAKYFTGQW